MQCRCRSDPLPAGGHYTLGNCLGSMSQGKENLGLNSDSAFPDEAHVEASIQVWNAWESRVPAGGQFRRMVVLFTPTTIAVFTRVHANMSCRTMGTAADRRGSFLELQTKCTPLHLHGDAAPDDLFLDGSSFSLRGT